MKLLEIPHFRRGRDVNKCVKQLLALLHGGIMCIDMPVSIDVDLIANIIGLPTDGEKLEQNLNDKNNKKTLAKEMKKTYGTMRGSKRIIINKISEPVTILRTKLMAWKLLRKCHKEEAPTGVIIVGT
jgi:hypothetical protein